MAEYEASTESPTLDRAMARAEVLRKKYEGRDSRATQVRYVREGNFHLLAPDLFSEDWPRPTVANLIDTMSRDFAASAATLPSFSCSSTSMLNDTARKFADTRTKIANHYVQYSNLAAQQQDGADGFNCYGLYAVSVEPDFDDKMPRIRVLDGATVYPLWDHRQKTIAALQRQRLAAPDIEARYPQVAQARKAKPWICKDDTYEVWRYVDKDIIACWLPDAGLVLENTPNPLKRCFIHAVPRPSGEGSWTGNVHGAYDDLIWPQIARHSFQMLSMENAAKQIRAPMIVPPDVGDVPSGPDAVLRTNNPQGVGQVRVNDASGAFQAMQWLERDMQLGGMTTAARQGQQSTGWTTGRGLEALADAFSGQLAAAQEMLKYALTQAIETCFAWDELLWPNLEKKIRGQHNGVPFETKYKPARDVRGDHTCDVTYGFAVGLDANRAVVYLLQLQGAGLMSKDTVARNLPSAVNATEELAKVELEQLRGAILGSLAGLAQGVAPMAAQGQDPSGLVMKLAQAAELMQKGKSIESVVKEVFAPPPAPEAPPAQPGLPGEAAPPEQGGGGMSAPAPADGGRPSLQMLLAGMNASGNPQMSASVSRMPAAVQ